jgi:RHS repeat-associated protein
MRVARVFILVVLAVSWPLPSFAQITNVTNDQATPIPGVGHDYIKFLSESVNPANGSVSLRMQAPTPPGRKLSIPFGFAYDTAGIHHLTTTPNGTPTWALDKVAYLQGGWSYLAPVVTYFYGTKVVSNGLGGESSTCAYYSGFVFQDTSGTRHALGIAAAQPFQVGGSCQYPAYPVSNAGDDFYRASTSPNWGTPNAKVVDPDGTVYGFSCISGPCVQTSGTIPYQIEDRNGNIITSTTNSQGGYTFIDTLGRTLISASSFASTSGDTINVSGSANPYRVTWKTVNSNFTTPTQTVGSQACPPPTNTDKRSEISSIGLPNGQQYTFLYGTDDPTNSNPYGLLSKITYPSGGWVKYTYGMISFTDGFDTELQTGNGQVTCTFLYGTPAVTQRTVSFDGTNIALQQDFTYSTNWQSGTYAWTTKTTTAVTHDQITGQSSATDYVYSFVNIAPPPNIIGGPGDQVPVEQTVTYKDGSGNVLRTVNKSWVDQYELKSQQTVLDNNYISETDYTYGSGVQVTERDDYDFGSGARGNLIRKIITNYQTFNTTPIYPNVATIFDRPCQSIVYGSSGTNRVAESDYFYDGSTSSTPCSTATTQTLPGTGSYTSHDETLYGTTASVARGNLTKVVKQCFQGSQSCASGNPTTTSIYDETGQISSTTDPNNHTTQYIYANSYTILSGGANISYTPTGTTNAFLTKIIDPLTYTQNFTYDFNTSQLTVSKDQNSLTTSYLYNDPIVRPTLTSRPDNGQTTIVYNDTALTVTPAMKINTSQTLTRVGLSDGVGHVKQTQLTTDPQGTVYTDTAYDGLNRVYTVSNPYRSGSDPTTSSGTTTYFYDALGRKCLEVPPDGTQPAGGVCPATQPANDLFTSYSGNTTTVTDQTGKSRKSVTDALGRLTTVYEDPAGLNYETDYAYDALGNLLSVNQKGGSTNSALWRTRSFTYDSLSRLLTSSNPEVGTITYKYDLDTNCASPNSFIGLLVSKTDARGIRTCAQYDAINRELVLNYSNGDPTVTTTYDQAACLTLSACQNIGHRTSMTDAAGSESWAYQVDAANNRSIHVDQRTTNSITKTSTYYFDQAGNVTQVVYPTGDRVVNYTFNAANSPITATDGSNGITYSTDFQTAPTGCLASAVCYTPQGTFYALSIGQTSSFTGLNLTHSYNSRLQPLEFKASSTGGLAIDITYGFVDPITTHNAGHVYSITNNLDTTRSQNFTYDQLNRITSALTTSTHATSPTHCWGETYTLDAWANFNSIAATTNSNYTGCSGESGFSTTADGNNHLPIFSYDPSGNGNTQSDGTISYTWDAESQLKSATNAGTTTNYTYDGDGRRVSKSNGKLYWYGSGGDILAETDASGNATAEYIFFGGKRIAMIPYSGVPAVAGTPIYYVEDMLGTSRVTTTNTGVVCYDADFYPYGGERPYTNTCAQNYKFEGKERDTETGNDDFGARYYSNRFGRWLSADWSAVPAPVPYANLTNPQTLNLYAMVADDPESFADLDGHDGWDVAWGVLNAVASNFVGTQRVQNGNSDVKSGQALGDALSVTVGGAVTITTVVGGVAADVGSGGAALVLTPAEALVATTAANGALQGGKNLLKSAVDTTKPGPNAGDSVPARGPQRDFTPAERDAVNKAGQDTGCHSCGTKDPGTKSGNFVPDHQPPNALNQNNQPQRLYPQCKTCSQTQGGQVNAAKTKKPDPPQ